MSEYGCIELDIVRRDPLTMTVHHDVGENSYPSEDLALKIVFKQCLITDLNVLIDELQADL